MSNTLWFRLDHRTYNAQLAFKVGRPLGWATLLPDSSHFPQKTVAGVLGELGAERLPRRYAVLVENADQSDVANRLERAMSQSPYFDAAWLLVHARRLRLGAGDNCSVALLTRHQISALDAEHPIAECVLDNGRIIGTIDPGLLPEQQSLEQAGATYADTLKPAEGEILLTTSPSNPFADLLRNTHSYFCVLNPVHRKTLPRGYIAVRNILLELDFPGLKAVASVRPLFDERVDPARIILDSTTHAAIGLPQGEPVSLAPAGGRAPRARAVVFGNRNCVARAGRTATVDIEKPVARIPEEMFDLLSLRPNGRVIVESIQTTKHDYRVSRTTVRAIPWRDRSPRLVARTRVGVPDYEQLVGDEDFPVISLDLVTREQLGISPGAAVYLRPAVSSEIVQQYTTVSFALIAAIISAAILQSPELALAMIAIYVALTFAVIVQRLRR